MVKFEFNLINRNNEVNAVKTWLLAPELVLWLITGSENQEERPYENM